MLVFLFLFAPGLAIIGLVLMFCHYSLRKINILILPVGIMRSVILAILFLLPLCCSGYQLPGCTDQVAMAELRALIESYQFRYQPKLDYFDCADMSTANWRLLQAAGYKPKIALRKEGPNNSHCYAICPLADGWVGIETEKQNLTHRTGVIITELEMWTILDTPEEVYQFDKRGPPVITGEVLEYVPKAPVLPPLFAQ